MCSNRLSPTLWSELMFGWSWANGRVSDWFTRRGACSCDFRRRVREIASTRVSRKEKANPKRKKMSHRSSVGGSSSQKYKPTRSSGRQLHSRSKLPTLTQERQAIQEAKGGRSSGRNRTPALIAGTYGYVKSTCQ